MIFEECRVECADLLIFSRHTLNPAQEKELGDVRKACFERKSKD